MFLDGLIQKRIAALLRPWLVEEPQWEVKLGFTSSLVVARNLRFDVSELGLGARFVLEDVVVEELRVRFDPWSVPAVDVDVRGLHVSLSTKEVVSDQVVKSCDTSLLEKKKILSKIDPEGTALFGNLEKLMSTSSSSSSWRSSFLNLILTKCCLHIHDVHVRVEFTFSGEVCAFLWDVVELNVQCQNEVNRSLARDFIGVFFQPLRECSFEIAASGTDLAVSRNDDVRCLSSWKEPCIDISLRDLSLVDVMLCTPEVELAVSPSEVLLIAAFATLIAAEPKHSRSGQQLWECVRKKVYSSNRPRRYLLYQVIDIVIISLQLVKAYQRLLLLIGCNVDKTSQRMVIGTSRGRNLPRSAMEEWTLISEIEKKLHAEGIAWARRVARSRVMSEAQVAENSITKPGQFVQEASSQLFTYTLNLAKISVVISPADDINLSASHKANQSTRISYMNLLSFCLIIREMIFVCDNSIFQQYTSFSMGNLEVASASDISGVLNATLGKDSASLEDSQREAEETKTIIWVDPAEIFARPGESEPNSDLYNDSAAVIALKKLLGELQLTWKNLCTRFEQAEVLYSRNPFVICDITSYWLFPGLKSPDLGLWKCCLGVGKLNFALGSSEVLSITVLIGQMLWSFREANLLGGTVALAHSSQTSEDIQKDNYHSTSTSNIKDIELALCKLLPDRPVELAAVIAGPHIHVSLTAEEHLGKELRHDLIIDVHNTALAVWPATDFGHPRLDDMGAEAFKWDGYGVSATPKEDNLNFISHGNISLGYYLSFGGLNADFMDSKENQQMKILLLKPLKFKLTSLRDYMYSFGELTVASSALLSGHLKGGAVIFCIEESSAFLRAFEGLFTQASIHTSGYADHSDRDRVACTEHDIARLVDDITVQHGHSTELDSLSTCVITCTLEVDPFNIIVHGSFKRYNTDSSFCFGDSRSKKLPEFGIWLSTYNILGKITCLEDKLEIHADFEGFRGAIFKYKMQIQNIIGQLEDGSRLLNFMDCLYETSVSSSALTFLLDCLKETLPSGVNEVAEKEVASTPSSPSTVPATSYILLEVTFNDFFVGRSSIKNLLSDTYQPETRLSFSAGKDFKTVRLKLQDGLVYIDPTALAAFDCCIKSYLECIKNLLSVELPFVLKDKSEPCEVISNSHPIETMSESNTNADNFFSWEDGKDFMITLNQVSIILLSSNESGEVREIIGVVDLCFNLRHNSRSKLSFSMSQLKIHSQILRVNMQSSRRKKKSQLVDDDSSERLQHIERQSSMPADGSFSPSTSAEKCTENDSVCSVVQETGKNDILKGFSAFISAEKLELRDDIDCLSADQGWDGTGSVSGLDITISLLEINMFLNCIESLSDIFTKEPASRSVTERRLPPINTQPEQKAEAYFPDGAIVAIQDVHQKMYVTVQHEENKFYLGGTAHYSLVDGKALFKVRSQKKRIWNFQTSWFTLASLHAKNDKGEPLLLSCSSKSGFVDVSTPNNSNDALWKVESCKADDHHDEDTYLEPHYHLSKNTFYLVNKRNGFGVAFVDGVPEFVNKPGNPFKFKIICPSSSSFVPPGRSENPPVRVDGSNVGDLERQYAYEQALVIPRITFAVDTISLTIVDELSDGNDKFPLVKGCIDSIEVAIQILTYKARVMSTFIATVSYFDTHNTQWRNLVHPCQINIFYRKRLPSQDALTCFYKVPVLLCLGMNRMDVSLTELSMDILLYVVGKLDLAGPFAVNSSAIMANCCKVKNQSGVTLLCHFNDSQDSRVGAKQSAVLVIRPIVNQPSSGSYVSIKLEALGTFSTSSIQLPLSESRSSAWRTRITSLQDARTYPGPVIVVDISKNVEEGLSVVVSPLLRIHNETEFLLELSFERPQLEQRESATWFLKSKDTIDDCIAAFEAINLSGGEKKALMSLSMGNFLFSFRPDSKGILSNSNYNISVGWSDKIQGGKAIRLSGIMDKLGYKVRKALYAQSRKCSFSLASSLVTSGDSHLATMHFLVQSIIRDVPITKPNDGSESKSSAVTFLQQREIFLLPTVRVYNLLQLDVHVLLLESDKSKKPENIGNQATVPCGSTAELYANPAVMCFNITLVAFNTRCKPVKSDDWIKKLKKQKDGIQFLDTDLEFCDGKYFASLRLTRDERGILEAVIFTQYTLRNNTGFPLFCFAPNQKPLSRDAIQKNGNITSPDLGSYLPPHSSISWFMKSNILCMALIDEETQVTLDLDSLSGLTEISLVKRLEFRQQLLKLGVSLGPLGSTTSAPAQVVSMIPRYVVSNDSDEKIIVQQCGYEDDLEGMSINSKHKAALLLVDIPSQTKKVGILDKLLWKHRAENDSSSLMVRFRLDSTGFGWSGPVCVASLGRFFLKFKTSSESPLDQANTSKQMEHVAWDFAAVNIIEEASSLVLHFSKLTVTELPYRIKNHLSFASITHYQKDVFEAHSLPPGVDVYYAWDDVTHPHKLVVRVDGFNISREISLDKLRPWKPFSRSWQLKETNGVDVGKIGYEVYADGQTRVLRISYSQDRPEKGVKATQKHMKIQLRFSGFDVQLLGHKERDIVKEEDPVDASVYSPIILGRLESLCLDSLFSDKQKYHQIRLRSINVDAKWSAAPFSSLLHGHQLSPGSEGNILFMVIVLNPSVSNVTQVKYSSILLQPVTINLDEETLLKVVPFWRKSLSQSTQSRQYYFDHFEIHPIKIIASFLPEESYSGYNSAQEALRTLLHSVIKIPTVKNAVVELNGVLVTHALVTTRELLIKCAQHYSWYAMRAIYIVKGSPLLPPSFASVFDDLASSSLDVFFDPSSNARGLTMGTFKLMSKYIKGKGFSGTKRYFGDLEETLRTAGSNVLFTAVTEISDSVLKGAEGNGFNGMVTGFHQGILKLAMEPSLLGSAIMEGGPDRKIVLDQSPGVDVPYIEGYLQAMLDATYKQEYLRVKVNDNEVVLKNLPPSSSLINEIVDRVRDFLISKALLKGDSSTRTRPFRHLRGENEWKIGPTILTLCEHLFVSFTIRMLRKQTGDVMAKVKPERVVGDPHDKGNIFWRWGFGKFVMSAMLAYLDGRLCRCIPNPIARRIVSGFLLSFLDKRDGD